MAQKPLDFETFLSRARVAHGDKFTYHQSDFTIGKAKTRITCPIHGDFWQMAYSHLRGNGCPKCHRDQKASSVFGFGINDYDGPVCVNYERIRSYEVWNDMIKRCYRKYRLTKFPTYIGCSVCEEWRSFSTFKKWFDENYIEGNMLDKDLLSGATKIYSPQTCCFLPPRINIFLSKDSTYVFCRSNGFYANTCQDKVFISFGPYETAEEAVVAVYNSKIAHIQELAKEYLQKGGITDRIYDALMSFTFPTYTYTRSDQSTGSPFPIQVAIQRLNAVSGEASTSSI